MIKTVFVALLLCCFSKSNEFKLLKATSQAWRGGIKDSKSGIAYNFEIVAAKNSKKLQIDSLIISGNKVDVSICKKNDVNPLNQFSKNDTLIISAQIYSSIKAENAILYYNSGKKQKSFTIENIQTLPVLNYP